MANTLHDHGPDWHTRRCLTCMAPWPCVVARALLFAFHVDAPRALRRCLCDLARHALDVRGDDGAGLRRQVVGWAFPYRRIGGRSL